MLIRVVTFGGNWTFFFLIELLRTLCHRESDLKKNTSIDSISWFWAWLNYLEKHLKLNYFEDEKENRFFCILFWNCFDVKWIRQRVVCLKKDCEWIFFRIRQLTSLDKDNKADEVDWWIDWNHSEVWPPFAKKGQTKAKGAKSRWNWSL